MESKKDEHSIILNLTNEEAIVFFDWLSRFNEADSMKFVDDQAEERVLWDIEASLEKVINESLEEDYVELLSRAREKVRD